MLFHQDILNGFQVIERAQLLTNMLKYNTGAKSVTLVMNFETVLITAYNVQFCQRKTVMYKKS